VRLDGIVQFHDRGTRRDRTRWSISRVEELEAGGIMDFGILSRVDPSHVTVSMLVSCHPCGSSDYGQYLCAISSNSPYIGHGDGVLCGHDTFGPAESRLKPENAGGEGRHRRQAI
jgi:hypothetical protein